ncbi:MAG: type II toxin-antitoxin system HicA family toxin [Terriglobia bacterium]
MTKGSRVTGKTVIAALRRGGFEVIRIKGSHYFLQHSDGRRTVVPVHAGEIIGPGLMAKILRDCEMTSQTFQSLL